jgi:hypothetical protein
MNDYHEKRFVEFLGIGRYSKYYVSVKSTNFEYSNSSVSIFKSCKGVSEREFIQFNPDLKLFLDFETAEFSYPSEDECEIKFEETFIRLVRL